MMGCLAQLEEGQQIARKFEVDVLLGPGSLLDIGAALESNQRFWGLQFKDELHDHIPPPPVGKLQAHLTIMRGCDHHCTYCIVPTTRGPQVSRHPDQILRELDSLLGAGVREVTLLGQNVNAYGFDAGAKLAGYPSFADLLRMVGKSGIERIKFTTSHPMNFTEDVAAAMAQTPAVCDFVHLPVQSGSDRVLRRMAREYSREKYLTHIGQIRNTPAGRGAGHRHHRGLSRRDRRRFSGHPELCTTRWGSTRPTCSSTRPGPARRVTSTFRTCRANSRPSGSSD